MDALGGTGDQVRATQFIGQSSGIYNSSFDTFASVLLFSRIYLFCNNVTNEIVICIH